MKLFSFIAWQLYQPGCYINRLLLKEADSEFPSLKLSTYLWHFFKYLCNKSYLE